MANREVRFYFRIIMQHLVYCIMLTKTTLGTNYIFSENKDLRNSLPFAPIKTLSGVVSNSRCAQLCLTYNEICFTYGYSHESQLCSLFDGYLSTSSDLSEGGWNYYFKSIDCSGKKEKCGDYSYRGKTCRCLKYLDIEVNASMAQDTCRNKEGGWLPRISNQLLNADLKEFVTQFNVPESVFIQGQRNYTDNEYYFDDKERMNFFEWSSDQPEGRTNEIILAVGVSFGERAWHDYHTFSVLSVVCEKLPQ